jgi:hypothetical protein
MIIDDQVTADGELPIGKIGALFMVRSADSRKVSPSGDRIRVGARR